jgi:hypothetical protein
MRRDLLATSEGRQVYDEALRRSEGITDVPRGTNEQRLVEFRPPDAATRVHVAAPVPAPKQSSSADVDASMPNEEDSRGIAWPYALVAAAAVFVAVAGALVARAPGQAPARRPVAMTLSQLGALRGSQFVSGTSVTLRWTKVRNASSYHVQIATAPGELSDAVVFAHGSRTVTASTPAYRLHVVGSQQYYWRVQARVGSTWQGYSQSRHFVVAQPQVLKPVALRPVSGSAKGGKDIRLCWSTVPHAIGYRLQVQGQRTRTVSGPCVTLAVRAKTYRWSVAALVKGTRTYTGAYSVAAVLHVRPTHRAERKPRSGRHSTRHTVKSRLTGVHKKAAGVRPNAVAKRNSASTSVEVALTVPRTSTTTFNGAALRSAIASVRPRAGTLTHSKQVSRRVTNAMNPTRAVARQHTTTGTSRATSSATVPRPPSTPTKKHAPVVTSIAPLPPAPPALPTRVVTSAPSAPTPRSTQQSSPIIVRPIVASQASTRAPATTSPSPVASSPVSQPTSPASPPTRAPVPLPTAVPNASQGHPEHPEHPVHPTHPAHPTHP